MSDIFGRKRIKELEARLAGLQHQYDLISWGYLGSIERRMAALEFHTGMRKRTQVTTDSSYEQALRSSNETKP